MDEITEELTAAKSDQELKQCLTHTEKFSALEICMAVRELRKRGSFNEAEFDRIIKVVRLKIIEGNPNKPTYYSFDTIFYISVSCSVLFGSIILALDVKNRWDKMVIIGFGITCLFFMYTLTTLLKLGAPHSLTLNFFGGMALTEFIGPKFIDKSIPFKKRSLLIPILMTLAFFAIFFLVYKDYAAIFNLIFQTSWRLA